MEDRRFTKRAGVGGAGPFAAVEFSFFSSVEGEPASQSPRADNRRWGQQENRCYIVTDEHFP
jgi:hypothetical protein